MVTLFAGVLIVSSAALLIKQGTNLGVPAVVLAAGRLITACAVLVPSAVWFRWAEFRKISARDFRVSILAGGLLALHFATWFESLKYISVASSATLVATSPLFAALGSWWFLRERLTPAMRMSLILGLCGSAIIGFADAQATEERAPAPAEPATPPIAPRASNTPGQPEPEPLRGAIGDALAIAGAIAIAGYYIVTSRVRARMPLVPYISITYSVAALLLSGVVLAAGTPLDALAEPTAWWLVVALALGPQLLGHTALNAALKWLSPTFVTLALVGEPVFSTLLAIPWLGEFPRTGQWIGGGALLVAIVMATRSATQQAAPESLPGSTPNPSPHPEGEPAAAGSVAPPRSAIASASAAPPPP